MNQPLNPEYVRKHIDTPEEINAILKQFSADCRRLFRRKRALTRKHPNKWAAIQNGVCVIADTPEALYRMVEAKGLDRTNMATAFLNPNPGKMILPRQAHAAA